MPCSYQIRYERLELCGIVVGLTIAAVLSYMLYCSMVDGWQDKPETRWHVLTISLSLLVLSVVACIYLCRRIQPTVRLHSPYLRTLTSVNSQLYLIGGVREQPPSYEAVTSLDNPPPPYITRTEQLPPPPYSAVFTV
uniref:Uncharacterized protein n=1 Tax=Homalodisca liturata TaxID=320908 RepID=A0A1B6I1A7_9HEMI